MPANDYIDELFIVLNGETKRVSETAKPEPEVIEDYDGPCLAVWNYLHWHFVNLDQRWAICFKKPEPKSNQLAYDPGTGEQPSYYWLEVEVLNLNGDEWELQLEGSIKWDGCSNWHYTDIHMCGPKDATLWSVIYKEARQLINHPEFDEQFDN